MCRTFFIAGITTKAIIPSNIARAQKPELGTLPETYNVKATIMIIDSITERILISSTAAGILLVEM